MTIRLDQSASLWHNMLVSDTRLCVRSSLGKVGQLLLARTCLLNWAERDRRMQTALLLPEAREYMRAWMASEESGFQDPTLQLLSIELDFTAFFATMHYFGYTQRTVPDTRSDHRLATVLDAYRPPVGDRTLREDTVAMIRGFEAEGYQFKRIAMLNGSEWRVSCSSGDELED